MTHTVKLEHYGGHGTITVGDYGADLCEIRLENGVTRRLTKRDIGRLIAALARTKAARQARPQRKAMEG